MNGAPLRTPLVNTKLRLFLATALLTYASPLSHSAGAQGVVGIPSADAAMNAGIAKAQATLPIFFERRASPRIGDKNFSIKIKYASTDNSYEHIWASNVVRDGDGDGDNVTASIAKEPAKIPDLKYGQKVRVLMTQLSDWRYMNSGKIHGGQTIRATLPSMSKADATELPTTLAPE